MAEYEHSQRAEPEGQDPKAKIDTRGGVESLLLESATTRCLAEGVEVGHFRLLPNENELPAMHGPVVMTHLNGPISGMMTRLDGGRAEEYTLLRGGVEIVPEGVPFQQAVAGFSEDVNVLLDGALVRRVAEQLGADPDRLEILGRFGVADSQLERLMLSFLPELETGGLGGGLSAEGLAQALVVHLLREHSSLGEGAKRRVAREPRGGLSVRQLQRALDYVGDNLSGDLSLAELAAAANLSPHHFSRLFKGSTGLSPHQYVIRERVERARGLLLGTDMTVGEIALSCGFAHHQHLARHLKRLTGLGPDRFRREARR